MIYEPIFPAELQSIALTLLSTLAVGEQWSAQQGFVVDVQSQMLSAPSRVYFSPSLLRSQISCLKGENRVLALCLGSRHWDGFIREECVRDLVVIDLPWVAPFVVQLLGEYVIQIINVIVAALPHLNRQLMGSSSELILDLSLQPRVGQPVIGIATIVTSLLAFEITPDS